MSTIMKSCTISAVAATLLVSLLTACSAKVPAGSLTGKYVASYPFGSARLHLDRDGTFIQDVVLNGQTPKTVRGTWSFDPKRSKITLHGAMAVVDGFGHLDSDWQKAGELVEQPVERLWFRIVIESSESYPYVKQ